MIKDFEQIHRPARLDISFFSVVDMVGKSIQIRIEFSIIPTHTEVVVGIHPVIAVGNDLKVTLVI